MYLLRRLTRLTRGMWIVSLLALCFPAGAQVSVPPELRGWEDWVLHGYETHRCPWLVPGKPTDDARVCAWPSPLELSVDERGGHFSQRWLAAAETWVPLPGNAENWPEEVTIDGSPAALVARDGAPFLRVAAGAHSVSGSFRWTRRPEFLALPPSVAFVSLSIGGMHLMSPQRNDGGVILGAQAVARQDDRVELRVFRLLDDEQPASLTTQLQLSVAGEAREIRLPAVLPEGFVPSAIEGPLAARLDPDGTLRVQVRPGTFQLTLEARGPSPVRETRLAQRGAPWPAEEVWSFKSEDRLRVATVEGASPVDPAQANVPGQWRELPAYRLTPAAALRLIERSRGLSAVAGNEITLLRTAWLDFSGSGYTIVDRLSGPMRQGWRLDMSAPYRLSSARTGKDAPLLITSGSDPKLTGVELRERSVDLTAVSRLARGRGVLPATGWQTRMAAVSARLVLAPGYRLLAAVGPDAAPGAWLDRWRLLDIFAVLLIATVAWRLLGIRTALIALGAAALTYQEHGAPTWLWLAVLVAFALERATPEGRLRRVAAGCRVLALLLLVIALVPFVISQVRLAVYPQLEALALPGYGVPNFEAGAPAELKSLSAGDRRADVRVQSYAGAAPAARLGVPAAKPAAAEREEEVVVTGGRASGEERYEPGAVVQAGPGLPDWHYHVYEYSWSGPVEANATVRFIISPPWLTRLWRVLGIALALLLVFEFAGRRLPTVPQSWRRPSVAAAAVLLVFSAAGGAAPRAEAASTPDSARLDQLRTQLLEPPRCTPDCAAVLAASVTTQGERLSIVLTVSALDAVGLALPGADPAWAPDLVQIDGAAAGWVTRSARGVRYVSLARGRHAVRLEGSLAGLDALSLTFLLVPHVIDVNAPGWDAGGLSERHLLAGALQLARRRQATAAAAATRQEEFPPFVDLERLFHLGHDWTVDTTVMRVAPKSAAFTVSVPLLSQESVTSAGFRAEGGKVAVGLAAGQNSEVLRSILPHSDTLELVASSDSSRAEHWRFEVAQSWHVDFSGVPAVAPADDSGPWTFEYYPRPGERLQLAITRPAGVAGGTLAFDRVYVQSVIGKRSSDTHLLLSYRSTQGGRHTLTLPADAVVTQVQSDDDVLALRPERAELSLSALPGRHTWSIDWHAPQGVALVTYVPPISQAAPAGNLQLSLRLPEDRWILYAFGHGIGPTILYWGELLVFVIAAWLLGRSGLTQLPARDWLLLGLGLSTFSWSVLVLFVLFVAVFEWRARHPAPQEPRRYQLLQVGCALLAALAILAVVAAVPQGLLAHPDMRIEPTPSAGELSWFFDQSAEHLPSAGVISVPLWWYKLAMLAWALWLSFALTRWARWAWQVFSRDGLWRESPGGRAAPLATAPAPAPPTPSES
jgi:hypothetical protein